MSAVSDHTACRLGWLFQYFRQGWNAAGPAGCGSPNAQHKALYSEALDRMVRLRVTTSAMRCASVHWQRRLTAASDLHARDVPLQFSEVTCLANVAGTLTRWAALDAYLLGTPDHKLASDVGAEVRQHIKDALQARAAAQAEQSSAGLPDEVGGHFFDCRQDPCMASINALPGCVQDAASDQGRIEHDGVSSSAQQDGTSRLTAEASISSGPAVPSATAEKGRQLHARNPGARPGSSCRKSSRSCAGMAPSKAFRRGRCGSPDGNSDCITNLCQPSRAEQCALTSPWTLSGWRSRQIGKLSSSCLS